MIPSVPVFYGQDIPTTLESPVPLAARAFRFLFQVPQWIQIAGAVVGVAVVLYGLRWTWRHRSSLGAWVSRRSRAWRLGAVAVFVLGAFAATFAGIRTWDFTQHSNSFCSGCHVMDSAFGRFSDSEHGKLECHDCHQQPVSASLRQLAMWVLERPEEIGAHAPVEDAICVTCHVTEDADSSWAQIAGTAGHRVHLESDSLALAEVACVTCHGLEVHRFVPGLQTCGQSGCHAEDATQIVLGGMAASETTFHCVACHGFTKEVGNDEALTRAFEALSPSADQCLDCHVSQNVQEPFDVDADPHEGQCGLCHNPHQQTTPIMAQETCASADCHQDDFDESPFHALDSEHSADCRACHTAHTWVAPTDCRACHAELR